MKVIDRLKYGFYNKDYFVSIYPNHIYIINYKSIIDFSNEIVKLSFLNFKLVIKGKDFKIIRKNKDELDITGLFSSMEIINE